LEWKKDEEGKENKDSAAEKSIKISDRPRPPNGPEPNNPDFDIQLDIEDVTVNVVDGVLIKGDDEEIRLLFYHLKPDGVDMDEETIKCKAVAEFRTSKSNFDDIAKNFNGTLKSFKFRQRTINDYIKNEMQSMFA